MKLKLEKNRLRLRMFEESEADLLYQMIDRNRAHLGEWFAWVEKTTKEEDIAKYLKEENEKYDNEKGVYLGIWNEGVLSGVINLKNLDLENKSAEMGYWLKNDSVGKGIMYQACKMLIDYSFKTLKLHRIDINYVTGNSRSKNLIKRLGFVYEGVKRESGLLHGKFVDHVSYGLLEKEWKG